MVCHHLYEPRVSSLPSAELAGAGFRFFAEKDKSGIYNKGSRRSLVEASMIETLYQLSHKGIP